MKHHRRSIRISLVAILLAMPGAALAEAPYVTDSAEPTDYHQLEINAFSEGVSGSGSGSNSTVGMELNYGLLPNLEFSTALPVGFSAPSRANIQFELTKMEVGVKYRFLEEDDKGWAPQISLYPSVEFTVGGPSSQETLIREFFPLWAQKSFGGWTVFGGGGLVLNPGPEGRDSWLTSIALTRAIFSGLEIGVEVVHETPEARDEVATTMINFGATWTLSKSLRLMGSAGPVVSANNTFSYYVGVGWAM